MYEFDHLITERNIDKATDLDKVVRGQARVSEQWQFIAIPYFVQILKKNFKCHFERLGFSQTTPCPISPPMDTALGGR